MSNHPKPVLSYIEVSKTCGEPVEPSKIENRKAIPPNVLFRADKVIK